jgi:hypothetical protein
MSEVMEQELLEQGSERALGHAQQRIVDGDLHAVLIAGGIVEAGDTGGAQIAENIRKVGLPMAAITLADDGGGGPWPR